MICPQCKKLGKRSRVYCGVSIVTCIGYTPYYDEDGNYHQNDPNKTTTEYSCSHGHFWSETTGKDVVISSSTVDKEER